MAYLMLVIAMHSVIIPFTLFSMHHAPPIISSDRHTYSIPKEKINASHFLISAHLNNKYPNKPLSVPFSQSSLNLFFDACDARNNFETFFSNLPPDRQTELISLAGQTKLNSPIITCHALHAYCGKTIISSLMTPHMEITPVTDYLYNEMVRTHITQRHPKRKQKNHSFDHNYTIQFDLHGHVSMIPKSPKNKQSYSFNGHVLPEDNLLAEVSIENQQCLVHAKQARKNNVYYLVSHEINKQIAYEIWITDEYEHIGNKQKMPHTTPITHICFSPNGHYLFTYSVNKFANNGCIPYLLHLGTAKNTFKHDGMIVPITDITTCLFNPQSTHFIVGSCPNDQATITVYDPSRDMIVHKTPTHGHTIRTITCNPQGTRMLVCSHDGCNGTYSLWNTENWNDITLIIEKHLTQDKTTHYPRFSNAGDTLLIPTQQGSLLFLHGITGEVINHTKKNKWLGDAIMHTIFTPNDHFCITQTIAKKHMSDSVSVWHTATGQFINYVLCKQSLTRGIGLSADGTHLIVTFKNITQKKIPLIENHDMQSLQWIKKHASMMNMYTLFHAHQAVMNKQRPSPEIIALLKQLPKTPWNVCKAVLPYLLGSTNTAGQATAHT